MTFVRVDRWQDSLIWRANWPSMARTTPTKCTNTEMNGDEPSKTYIFRNVLIHLVGVPSLLFSALVLGSAYSPVFHEATLATLAPSVVNALNVILFVSFTFLF